MTGVTVESTQGIDPFDDGCYHSPSEFDGDGRFFIAELTERESHNVMQPLRLGKEVISFSVSYSCDSQQNSVYELDATDLSELFAKFIEYFGTNDYFRFIGIVQGKERLITGELNASDPHPDMRIAEIHKIIDLALALERKPVRVRD